MSCDQSNTNTLDMFQLMGIDGTILKHITEYLSTSTATELASVDSRMGVPRSPLILSSGGRTCTSYCVKCYCKNHEMPALKSVRLLFIVVFVFIRSSTFDASRRRFTPPTRTHMSRPRIHGKNR